MYSDECMYWSSLDFIYIQVIKVRIDIMYNNISDGCYRDAYGLIISTHIMLYCITLTADH